MLLYHVRVEIDRERERVWYAWMVETHIHEVLESGYFPSARIGRIDEETRPWYTGYLIQYECESRKRFQEYTERAAPALQRDHANRFGGAFSASRTVVEVPRTYCAQATP